MLMTPERSENIPPRAARTNGVANRIVDQRRAMVKMSLIILDFGALQQTKSSDRATEECFSRHKKNDDALQDLNNILRDVFGETVDVDTAVLQNREEQRRKNHADGMIPSEQGHSDTGEAIIV